MKLPIEQQLIDWGIEYDKAEHPPVFTCAEAEEKVPPLPGAHIKNLFLRDRKGRRHFLLVVACEKRVDLRALAQILAVDKLGMASGERLQKYLGVEPGAVTLLALVNDREKAVELVIDAEVWAAEALQCHPLINTATLVIARNGIERLLEKTGHLPQVVEVSARED